MPVVGLLGWPALLLAAALAIFGNLKGRSSALAYGALLTLPAAWYLGNTPDSERSDSSSRLSIWHPPSPSPRDTVRWPGRSSPPSWVSSSGWARSSSPNSPEKERRSRGHPRPALILSE